MPLICDDKWTASQCWMLEFYSVLFSSLCWSFKLYGVSRISSCHKCHRVLIFSFQITQHDVNAMMTIVTLIFMHSFQTYTLTDGKCTVQKLSQLRCLWSIHIIYKCTCTLFEWLSWNVFGSKNILCSSLVVIITHFIALYRIQWSTGTVCKAFYSNFIFFLSFCLIWSHRKI